MTNSRGMQFDARFLQLPLFIVSQDPETVMADCVEVQTIGYIPEPDGELDQPYQWSSEGVEKLHSVLLHESLAILAGRGNGEQKREVLEWIFEPDYIGQVIKNGVPTHVFTWDIPWSFTYCCRLEKMLQPDIIRDFIRSVLPEGSVMFFK